MSASLTYAWKQAEKREAYEAYNYAEVKLELAKIKERLAEVESQYEPLSKLTNNDEVKELLICFAKFVVTGSWPAYTPDVELTIVEEDNKGED